jgi:hypothetical protein
MQVSYDNLARRAQTELEVTRLLDDLQRWLAHRRDKDTRGQHRTQLAAVESLVKSAGAALGKDIQDNIDPGLPRSDVYDACRLADLRIIWLRRVWQFFREKFDQRDNPEMEQVLRAADEVVWSCYRQVFDQGEILGLGLRQGPAPLPFVEARYSPEAFPVELVPANLRGEVDSTFLGDYLNELPVPVVRLPPACVYSPWWLIYLGHEVGHHIQYDLLDDGKLVVKFREQVEDLVHSQTRDAAAAEQWGRWSREIFADAFSLVAMGQWALWAMVELELSTEPAMSAARADYPSDMYPPAAVRLKLLESMAAKLNLNTAGMLQGLDLQGMAAERVELKAQFDLVTDVAGLALSTPLPGLQLNLPELYGFDPTLYAPGVAGKVSVWSSELEQGQVPTPQTDLLGARLAASAATSAWSRLRSPLEAVANEQSRMQQRSDLVKRVRDLISKSNEPGSRTKFGPDPVPGLGAGLAAKLIGAGRQQLET